MIIKPIDEKYLGSVADYDIRLVSYEAINEQSKNITVVYTKRQIEISNSGDANGVTFTPEEIQELVDILRHHAIGTDPVPKCPHCSQEIQISPDSPA
jgi:hypothetical protein